MRKEGEGSWLEETVCSAALNDAAMFAVIVTVRSGIVILFQIFFF